MQNLRKEAQINHYWEGIRNAVLNGKATAIEFEADGEFYVRTFRPGERLILLGGGHVSQPLCRLAAELGFRVAVVDDRPSFANRSRFPEAEEVICDDFKTAIHNLKINENDYVAVITRGHRYDSDCLRAILPGTMPYYLGMIGSKRRVIELLHMLEQEGFSRTLLDQIHTPIGLPIHALTLPEIAVSIAAELIQCRRETTDRRSKSRMLVTEHVDPMLLQFLAEDPEPKALAVVYETSGSTPVKAGAWMALTNELRTAGTIGGGCGESAVLHEARGMIGTGKSRTITVDMSDDVAEEEGMVCGGQMKVWIADSCVVEKE